MTFETFVSVTACFGIAAGTGWLIWFAAAKGYQARLRREDDRAAATMARLAAVLPPTSDVPAPW